MWDFVFAYVKKALQTLKLYANVKLLCSILKLFMNDTTCIYVAYYNK